MKPKRYAPLQRALRASCRSAHNDFLVALADDFIAGAIKQHRRVYLASPTNGSLVHHAEILSLKGDSYRLRGKDLGEGRAEPKKTA